LKFSLHALRHIADRIRKGVVQSAEINLYLRFRETPVDDVPDPYKPYAERLPNKLKIPKSIEPSDKPCLLARVARCAASYPQLHQSHFISHWTQTNGDSRFGRPLELRKVHWVKPKLVVEVTFLTWTGDGLLRQVAYQGLREDKNPKEVRLERACS
jgi:bifunctional non-homologous end joining protein LigD